MLNNTNLASIPLDQLHTITGGYHDPGGPEPRKRTTGDSPDGQRQQTAPHPNLGQIVLDAISKGFKLPFGGK